MPAAVFELHHRVSSDEPQDLPAGEPNADGDGQSLHLPAAAQGLSKRGWDPNSRAELISREIRGRESGGAVAEIKDN